MIQSVRATLAQDKIAVTAGMHGTAVPCATGNATNQIVITAIRGTSENQDELFALKKLNLI